MNNKIPGLHHVTAIASDPQRNLDFYVGLLGLRFVKRTVNFDDPGTYHFYFGDRRGTPGTILTFFPWPGVRRGIRGTGQIEATAFAHTLPEAFALLGTHVLPAVGETIRHAIGHASTHATAVTTPAAVESESPEENPAYG